MNLHQRLFNFCLRLAVALAAVFGLPTLTHHLPLAGAGAALAGADFPCPNIAAQRLTVQLLN